MFGADAFMEKVEIEATNRKFGDNYEIDFCSTLHVHNELKIRDRPAEQMEKMRFLRGSWESWLKNIVQKHREASSCNQQEEAESSEQDLTPTKTSVRATHYIVGETKISEGLRSLLDRLLQLERNVKMLCERKGVKVEEAPVRATEIIALAGIGVPQNSQLGDKAIRKKIQHSKKKLPILASLLKEERVFVFEVDSFHLRLEKVEDGMANMDKKLQEQGKMLQEQGKMLQEQGKMLQEQGKMLQKMNASLQMLLPKAGKKK
jgi:hypothetical protein